MFLRITGLLLLLALPTGLPAEVTKGEETYHLIFREGTLDEFSAETRLIYRREVSNSLDPTAAERESGEIALVLESGETDRARLRFLRDGKHRELGVFPPGAGNPIIMVFMEMVTRDVATLTGGGEFYIRNRLKEALIEDAPLETGTVTQADNEVEAQTVTLRPFAKDPNQNRMRGLENMELSFTVSQEVPGWYHALKAEATGEDGTIYSQSLTLQEVEKQP